MLSLRYWRYITKVGYSIRTRILSLPKITNSPSQRRYNTVYATYVYGIIMIIIILTNTRTLLSIKEIRGIIELNIYFTVLYEFMYIFRR